MPSYSEVEVSSLRVEWRVPLYGSDGVCWAEVMKAIRAAHVRLWDEGIGERDKDVYDDQIRIKGNDENIVVFIVLEKENGSLSKVRTA